MQFIKSIFNPIIAVLKFINNYFKAMLFLLIVFVVFTPKGELNTPNLVQIDIKGAIFSADEILSQLEEARIDENIKGVLLNIDSPGGALSPSVELAEQVKRLSQSKPVVAYAAGNMTSGSYYAGVNANKIIANKGSMIGSIGVIMQVPNISELATKIGISEQVVKAGEYKEMGTYTRTWSKLEKDALQEIANRSYELFITDVASARNLEISRANEWANARVFLANDALNVGLIDDIGGYYDARSQLEILAQVDKAEWKQTPQIEKFFKKLTEQGANAIISALFPIIK
ncbi:signal peptide peptidase SppA [Campylobacter majalis]|uniref:signal peptide peptidase SppA n=1 Tax=Campylobacter majalis TaxID=2790656 RepID=UPI003D68C42C